MDVTLSHTTALEALRLCDRPAPPTAAIPSELPHLGELRGLIERVPLLRALSHPLHLIASGGRSRRRTRLIHAHLQSAQLPPGSLWRLSPELSCVSPEHLCVQMAPRLTQLELVVLLSELLGLYAIDPASEDGMRQRREPIMTPERLLAHLDRLGPMRGVAQVRRALALACVRSGSPRETKLSLRLALRPGLGGAGLNVLSMNEPLEVRRIHDRMRRGVRKPDILLAGPETAGRPRKLVAVEYHGRRHDEPERLVQDAIRSNELRAIDVIELIVRREQYRDLDYMDGLVALIREKLGLPPVTWTAEERQRYRSKRRELYEELEHIDGVHWNGRERKLAREKDVEPFDVVPVDAYGLD